MSKLDETQLIYCTNINVKEVKNMDIGKLIRDERTKQGLSIKQLARMAEISDAAIRNWEKGKRTDIGIVSLGKVLKALNITLTIGSEKGE